MSTGGGEGFSDRAEVVEPLFDTPYGTRKFTVKSQTATSRARPRGPTAPRICASTQRRRGAWPQPVEKLDLVPRRVVDKDLRASGPGDDLVAELQAGGL